jgi:hypothetical protein
MSMSIDEMIAVLQAHKDGEAVECRITSAGQRFSYYDCGGHFEWSKPCGTPPTFNFGYYDYRVKPEPPKPRTFVLHTCAGRTEATVFLPEAATASENIEVKEVLK